MRLPDIENNPLLKHTLDFAILLVDYCESLEIGRKYVVSRQLLRCGTSIGANAMEAQNAESKADFIHKIKIAAKEADETQYWLLICKYSNTYPDVEGLLRRVEEIQRILNSILGSAKKRTPISYLVSLFI